jgi:hypothetical protein
MQSRNDHIEDLVRQAAELNPVKAKGADWDSVFNKLVNKQETSVKAEAKSKKYLFLLLFLLSSLLCNEFYYILYNNHTEGNADRYRIEPTYKNDLNKVKNEVTIGSNKKRNFNTGTIQDFISAPVNKIAPVNSLLEPGEIIISVNATDDKTGNPGASEVSDSNTNENIIPALQEDLIVKNKDEISTDNNPEDQKIPVKTEPAKQKRFYAAFLLGPDISTVKFSEIKAAGHGIGITAGIKLTNRFSFETGAFFDQKKYVAEGEYFKAEKLSLPDHGKLLNVSGYCNMIEIPLNIRYNVATKNNYNLFVLTGVSSYLVQKEDYDYQYTRYNNLYSSNKSYNKSSTELFNVINLAAGYEKKVGKTTALRVEPYVKLPVKGMGVGDMRLSSAGVLVGIRYPF